MLQGSPTKNGTGIWLQVPYWAQNYIEPCKLLIISNLQGIFLRYIFIFPSPYFINIKA
jgi:hypothetical protein